MSWSISFIGTPEKISEALQKESERLQGQSKIEFDAVLPHMDAIVNQNKNVSQTPILKITANGHAYDGYSSCSIAVEHVHGALV